MTAKLQVPVAQELVSKCALKLSAAETLLADAEATFAKLAASSELEDGVGVVVNAADFSKVRKARDGARETVERLTAALREAESRLGEAQAADAEGVCAEKWAWMRRTASDADATLSSVLRKFEEARDEARKYLEVRASMLNACPNEAWGVKFAPTPRPATQMEGIDRVLRLCELIAAAFHPRYAANASSSHGTEIPRLVETERAVLRLLGERHATPQPQKSSKPAA